MYKVKKILRSLLTFILTIILILILIFLSSKYMFKNKVPNVFGYSILKVVTGSMEPNINVGNYVVIKKYNHYKTGDIVTFIDNNDNVVTHRIKEIKGNRVITKGDANNTVDDEINISNIKGKVIYQFSDIFRYKDKIVIVLLGLFVLGGLITICIPSRKK